MFVKISKTEYPPLRKPVLVWDGACPFCKFWVDVLKKYTGDRVEYAPYQRVAEQYRDIPVEAFKGAVQFIEPNGLVYSGPDTAYRSLLYLRRPLKFLHRLYKRSRFFAEVSDYVYYAISENRPLMHRVTMLMFGRNPEKLRPYGLVWIVGLVSSVLLVKMVRKS